MRSKQAIDLSEYLGLSRSTGIVFSRFDRRRRSAPGSFSATSTTSRINAFPRLQLLDPTAQRLHVIAAPGIRPAPRTDADFPPWAAFWFRGCNAAMPPLRYALTQLRTAGALTPSRLAACFCCKPPSTSSIAFRLVSRGIMGLAIRPAYRGSIASQRSRHCLVG